MREGHRIAVVIPALDEERAIGLVVAAIPPWVDAVVVVDNGSVDATAQVALAAGAQVVAEPRRGYGAACQAGLAALGDRAGGADIVVFLDGDYSDYPEQMDRLVDPIVAGRAALVVGSRVKGQVEARALTPVQRFGNWLATALIRWRWGVVYTDLGPFRAVTRTALADLALADRDYGWTVEMQARAARRGLAVLEVPVDYRRRIGVSKISGTLGGSWRAGRKILAVIGAEALRPAPRRPKTLANPPVAPPDGPH
ncbi:MAG: glycosyltransferase family 2 protein [Candidatus Competibacterales bacterium]